MAMSSCPKCDGHSFEAVDQVPHNSTVKVIFIQCQACGTVVGVKDWLQQEETIRQIKAGVKAIIDHLGIILP